MNMVSAGAEPFHRRDGGVGHAGKRSAPARMRRADHSCPGVSEKHRGAIGGEDSEQQAAAVGDHRVGVRPFCVRPAMLRLKRIG